MASEAALVYIRRVMCMKHRKVFRPKLCVAAAESHRHSPEALLEFRQLKLKSCDKIMHGSATNRTPYEIPSSPSHILVALWPIYAVLHTPLIYCCTPRRLRRKHYVESISISPRHHRFRPSANKVSTLHGTHPQATDGVQNAPGCLSSALAGPTEEETARPVPRVQVV